MQITVLNKIEALVHAPGRFLKGLCIKSISKVLSDIKVRLLTEFGCLLNVGFCLRMYRISFTLSFRSLPAWSTT